MTEFDKWWINEMDYAASRHDTDEYAESEIKAREQRVARKAWNAAIDEAVKKTDYWEYIKELKTNESERL